MLPISQLGRIAQEIELKETTTESGKNVVINNTLVIKQNKDTVVYLDFTVWGKLAETIVSLFKKGDELILTGELRNKRIKAKFVDIQNKENTREKEVSTVFLLVKGFDFTNGKKRQEQ